MRFTVIVTKEGRAAQGPYGEKAILRALTKKRMDPLSGVWFSDSENVDIYDSCGRVVKTVKPSEGGDNIVPLRTSPARLEFTGRSAELARRMEEILHADTDYYLGTQHHHTVEQRRNLVPKLATAMILSGYRYVISTNPNQTLKYGDAINDSNSNIAIEVEDPYELSIDMLEESLTVADWFLRSHENNINQIIDMPTLENAASNATAQWRPHKRRLEKAERKRKEKLERRRRAGGRVYKIKMWQVVLLCASPFALSLAVACIVSAVCKAQRNQ